MSPVAAPSTLGETLAERLARKAAEAKAREEYAKGDPMATNPDAPPEGPALAATSGSASPGNRDVAGIASSRGIPSVAMGSGDGIVAPDVAGLSDAIAKLGKPVSPMEEAVGRQPAPTAPSATATAPAAVAAPVNDLGSLKPIVGKGIVAPAPTVDQNITPALSEARARAQAGGMDRPGGISDFLRGAATGAKDAEGKSKGYDPNTPVVPQYTNDTLSPVEGDGSLREYRKAGLAGIQAPTPEETAANVAAAGQTGAEAQKPMSAYDQAKAQQKPLGVKGGIALAMSIAADAFAGMAGRQGGYTAAMLGQRRQDLADATNRIQGEIDRLQAEQDKAYNKKRQEQLDRLHEAEVNAQIENNKLQRAQQYEKWQNDYKLATDEHERKVLKDKMDGMAKQSQAELRKATIEKLQRDGRVLAPGETYSVWDPVSQSRVVIDRNDQQVVTTTDNTKSMVGADGKTYTQTDTTVQTKGPNGTVRIPPSPEVVQSTRAKLLEKARKEGNLTQDQINYLEATGGLQ